MSAVTSQATIQRLEDERRTRIRGRLQERMKALPRRARWPSLRQQLEPIAVEQTARLYKHLYEAGKKALLEPTFDGWQRNIREVVKATPRMRIPEFVEHRTMGRRLPMTNGLTPGRVRISKQEIARAILLAVHEPGVRTISVCMSPQMCKTFILECIYAYFCAVDPTTVMIVMPDDTSLKEFVYEKLNKMIELTPSIANRLTRNDLGIKMGPGFTGIQTIAGSDRRLAGKTIRITLMDEIDKMGITKSGDPVDLGEKRGVTFKDMALGYRSCTPTTSKARIWTYLNAGDFRRFFVECPHCQEEVVLKWSDNPRPDEPEDERSVRWATDGTGKAIPGTVRVHCPACDHPLTEPERRRALRAGFSRQTKSFDCCGKHQDPMKNRNWDHDHYDGVGYAMCSNHRLPDGELNPDCRSVQEPAIPDLPGSAVSNRDASFHGWHGQSQLLEIDDIATDHQNALVTPNGWQSFMNNNLALPYDGATAIDVDTSGLWDRRGDWTASALDDRGIFLTAGIDRQKNYLAVQVILWFRGREWARVAYEQFDGNTLMDAVWLRLDAYLKRTWFTKSGRPLRIEAACVDTGGGFGVSGTGFAGAEKAKQFCYNRAGRLIFPIAGARNDGDVTALKDIWDPRAALGKAIYYVGTVAGKMMLMDSLVVQEAGPLFAHFPADVDQKYLKELTAEEKVVDRENGKISWQVKKGHRRNEAMDTWVYALAASYAFETYHQTTIDRQADLKRIPYLPSEEDKRRSRMSDETLKASRERAGMGERSEKLDRPARPVVNVPQRQAPAMPKFIPKPRRPGRAVPRF